MRVRLEDPTTFVLSEVPTGGGLGDRISAAHVAVGRPSAGCSEVSVTRSGRST